MTSDDNLGPDEVRAIDDVVRMQSSEEAVLQDRVVTQQSGKLWIALLCIPFVVIVADACLFQADGFFGPAVFLMLAAVAFGFAVPGRANILSTVVAACMLILTAWRLAWCGNLLAMVLGYWLLFAYCLSLRGQLPYLLRVFGFVFECVPGAFEVLRQIERSLRSKFLPERTAQFKGRSIEFALPAVAVLMFGGVFVMANADVVQFVSTKVSTMFDSLNRFFAGADITHVIFWGVVGILSAGVLRPVVAKLVTVEADGGSAVGEVHCPLYSAFRNTLIAVIAVFGAYLLFEVRAFATGKPPEGFTYSSYAHEGAAWLTVALGLSTVTLSLIFRGELLLDHRYGKLERLAWGWSVLNFLLAVAVINRMWIYVGYNGMTQMRVVGLLGIAAVLFGFVLVLFKIHRRHNFRWLLRRQCWVAGFMIWLLSVLPIDVLIHRYNVRAILAGNPAPIVQITEHPFTDECLAELVPLCESTDQLVADGMKSIIRIRHDALMNNEPATSSEQTRRQTAGRDADHWTGRQWFVHSVKQRLGETRAVWEKAGDSMSQSATQWESLQQFALRNYW